MLKWLSYALHTLKTFDGRLSNRAHHSGTIYYIISKDPSIISIPYGSHYPFLNLLSKDRKTYFLFWLWSSTESEKILEIIKNEDIEFNKRYPKKSIYFYVTLFFNTISSEHLAYPGFFVITTHFWMRTCLESKPKQLRSLTRYIRDKTIEKMKEHRETFIKLVQTIYDKEGVHRNFSEEWNRIFINKLLTRQYKIEI